MPLSPRTGLFLFRGEEGLPRFNALILELSSPNSGFPTATFGAAVSLLTAKQWPAVLVALSTSGTSLAPTPVTLSRPSLDTPIRSPLSHFPPPSYQRLGTTQSSSGGSVPYRRTPPWSAQSPPHLCRSPRSQSRPSVCKRGMVSPSQVIRRGWYGHGISQPASVLESSVLRSKEGEIHDW